MAQAFPKVLILGHCFVRRLSSDLARNFDPRASQDLNVAREVACVCLRGKGGQKVASLRQHDLAFVSKFQPQILILEIRTNDLGKIRPEVVGSDIEDLVCHLHHVVHVNVIGVCLVIPRADAGDFNHHAEVLKNYLSVVLEALPFAFVIKHIGLFNPSTPVLLEDGVHLNAAGQYALYRSYRGAILRAAKLYSE